MKDWKEIYELPLSDSYIDEDDGFRSKRVVDNKGQFVFEFLNVADEAQVSALCAINGTKLLKSPDITFTHKDGYILIGSRKAIMIRGWGNLTGTGGHNLSEYVAATVQDGFANYMVDQLNKRVDVDCKECGRSTENDLCSYCDNELNY